jgi:hypothetical protein
MSAPEEWEVIRTQSSLAVHRGEEQIFYLDAKAEGRETAVALAKLLNDRAELLEALKDLVDEVRYLFSACDPDSPEDVAELLNRCEALIATAEARP